MNKIDIKNLDTELTYFHYTDKKNLNSIYQKGLLPHIGKNSRNLELSEKVFFTIGFDNTLILMDAWIKWLTLRPKSNFVYMCGSFYMKHKIFPRFIVNIMFKKWINNDRKKLKACQKLDSILNNSVYLKLDLVKNVDFSFNDIDEVKNQGFSRKHLSYIYSYGYDINDSKLEPWNMHTLSNKIIEKGKISLIKNGDSILAKDIILFMVNHTNLNIKKELPFLYKYLKYISYC